MTLDARVSGPLRRAALQFLVSVPLIRCEDSKLFCSQQTTYNEHLMVKARIEKHKFKRFGKKLAYTV